MEQITGEGDVVLPGATETLPSMRSRDPSVPSSLQNPVATPVTLPSFKSIPSGGPKR